MMSTWRQTHRKNGIDGKGRQWSYMAAKQGNPRLSASYQGPRRGKKEFSLSFTGTTALLTHRLQASSLQNCATINFSCFKPLSSWYFVTATLEKEYTYYSTIQQKLHNSSALTKSRIPKRSSKEEIYLIFQGSGALADLTIELRPEDSVF